MSIKARIQEEITKAMRTKDSVRLECLRMAKGALVLKEKEAPGELPEDVEAATLRAEIKKRQQSAEIYRQHGRNEEAEASENEIKIIQEFLPQQMTPEQVEAHVRAYLADHPEVNHAGKLTGAMKKELGDKADGKTLNEVCRKVLES